MNTLPIIVIAAIAIFVVVMGVRTFRSKRKPATMPLFIPGLCSGQIGYNREHMDRTNAEEIGNELLRVKMRVWPEYLRIYQTGIEYPINSIIIDPKWVDPDHKAGIKCDPGTWVVTLNPNPEWGDGYGHRKAFAAELHSVIRTQLYGRCWYDKDIDDKDAIKRDRAARVWKRL